MGPWAGLFRFFAREIGKQGGKRVASDVNAAERAFRWTHSDKIAELKGDTGLSPSYVKELIESSTKLEDLKAITIYMQKNNGYTRDVMESIYRKLIKQMDDIQDKAALKEMIRVFREKGTSLLDHFDHFV